MSMFGIPQISQGWFEESIASLKTKPLETAFKLDTQLKAALVDALVIFDTTRLAEINSELKKFINWYEEDEVKNQFPEYVDFHLLIQSWIYLIEVLDILSICSPLKDDWRTIQTMHGADKILEILELKCMLTFSELSKELTLSVAQLINRIDQMKELKLIHTQKYGGVEYLLLSPRGYSMIHKYIKR